MKFGKTAIEGEALSFPAEPERRFSPKAMAGCMVASGNHTKNSGQSRESCLRTRLERVISEAVHIDKNSCYSTSASWFLPS
jgi:hypothetical protein